MKPFVSVLAAVLAALIIGTMPIWVALMESLIDRRRPSLLLSASLVVGFGGLVVLTALVASATCRVASAGAGPALRISRTKCAVRNASSRANATEGRTRRCIGDLRRVRRPW